MLKKLKLINPDKEYPSNIGKKWTIEEENILLEELDKNLDINLIAKNHDRTIGGIIGRQKDIAYKMHIANIPIEEIIIKTKLTQELILEIIANKEQIKVNKEQVKENKEQVKANKDKILLLENEIIEMRLEIKELKDTITEMLKNFSILGTSSGMPQC